MVSVAGACNGRARLGVNDIMGRIDFVFCMQHERVRSLEWLDLVLWAASVSSSICNMSM